MSRHIPSPTNSQIVLHQEFAMRTAGYDEVARVETADGWTTFAEVVRSSASLDEAIRAVTCCCWLSETDWSRSLRDQYDCRECLEVARS